MIHPLIHHTTSVYRTGASSADSDQRRELSFLLCSAFLRAAGHDRYEQGDIWAKVAAHRPTLTDARPDLAEQVERLVTTDAGSTTALRRTELRHLDDWLIAFEHAGQRLRHSATAGRLHRGIRAVSAHHILFHWNRLGLAARTQATLAQTAASVSFNGPRRNTLTHRPDSRR